MREIIFGGASTLDNFFARLDHGMDWLRWSDEVAQVISDFWPRVDTVIMGRKTYEIAATSGQGAGYPGVANYVFSRSWIASPNPAVTLVRENTVDFIRRLKQQPGKDICLMGGGDFARSLFEADLIDEVGLNVHPVLLGEGIPAFHRMSHQINLELKDVRQFKTGCVLLTYRVAHKA